MKEYIITYRKNGTRMAKRVFAYHTSDAYKRLQLEEGRVSLINAKPA